ncbi:hypothetical protein Q4Q34_10365 [Flavivirga abyssicola]|uniref:hypothetical protein n=1 Tax=Flavivirga abyssicola TaxID=3063533 RepID=UPI0026E0C642|nr:hypothetical protein [Flavivirga sp. MEBiC07777]WVK11628.1 hypothetical protein Q4Q34_10365 [Flavivirga sp. MEBiC07777]
MKALKITLFVTLLMLTLASCTKQDLNEDDVLKADENIEAATNTDMPTPYTGGKIDD